MTTIEDRSANRKYTVKSKYVIACDGAKSPVRKHLSIGTEGEDLCVFNAWVIKKKKDVLNERSRDNDDHSYQR